MKGPVDDLIRNAQKARLEFIRIELETGTTLADIAQTAYGMHHREHGDRAYDKARQACEEALDHINNLAAFGADTSAERTEASRLEEWLERLGQSRTSGAPAR